MLRRNMGAGCGRFVKPQTPPDENRDKCRGFPHCYDAASEHPRTANKFAGRRLKLKRDALRHFS
jgi:hypothetical protein